jgi:tripartite-type tricarboxylate transporter receptor subunit TctC
MTVSRRLFNVAAVSTVWGSLPAARAAQGDAYPNKPIRLVVPFSPGAANDTIARLIGQKVGDSWGQPIIIENRAGGGGAVGANLVAKARPDGYTLLFTNPGPSVITPLITREKTYSVADLVPIISICDAPLILVAHPDFPPNNVLELVAYAKSNPGKVRFGSADAGGIPSLALKMFQAVGGADVLAVPYKGSAETVAAAVSGTIDVVYASYASSQALLTAHRLKVIGVAGPKRLAAVPQVPTLAQSGIVGADALVWFGLAAPRGTPEAIVGRINSEVNKALLRPDVRERLAQLELEPAGGCAIRSAVCRT